MVRSPRAVLVTLVAACGMTFLSAGPAAACSCAGTTDGQALDAADVVFRGELVEVRTRPGESFSSMDPEQFVFRVADVYKGKARAQQVVVTARGGESCGLELTGRGPFLVFAYRDAFDFEVEEGQLYSNLCNGSRSLSEGPVPAAFGSGTPSEIAPPIDLPERGESRAPIVAGAAGALALAGGLLLVRRVRRRQRPATS